MLRKCVFCITAASAAAGAGEQRAAALAPAAAPRRTAGEPEDEADDVQDALAAAMDVAGAILATALPPRLLRSSARIAQPGETVQPPVLAGAPPEAAYEILRIISTRRNQVRAISRAQCTSLKFSNRAASSI
jgi:hypothetical protein